MRDVWKIEQGLDFATLYSAQRMPHSSRRGPMDPARKALRAAIEGINARPGKILEGTYSSSIDGFFDVENVVIYNIETATFRNASTNGYARGAAGRSRGDPTRNSPTSWIIVWFQSRRYLQRRSSTCSSCRPVSAVCSTSGGRRPRVAWSSQVRFLAAMDCTSSSAARSRRPTRQAK